MTTLKIYVCLIVLFSLLTACTEKHLATQSAPIDRAQVIENYADIAFATFLDSLLTAGILRNRIRKFIQDPSENNFQLAKSAWLAARIPYGQSEVFRFGNVNVDDWEGKVNAWPIDEGLIDYVDQDQYEFEDGNQFAEANIIAGKAQITPQLLRSFHEKGGAEANVAIGYHAIEFLLWGQDLNAQPEHSGLRPYTDYAIGSKCTHQNCERRAAYLLAASNLLVTDLKTMVADWAPNKNNYRKQLTDLDSQQALGKIIFSMGSLSRAELAGERLNVALLAHSQEDEHSCFSDNTHSDAQENARGIQNIYIGRYQRIDGSLVQGVGLEKLLAEKNQALANRLTKQLQNTLDKAAIISQAAIDGEHFDQQIKAGNEAGNERIKAMILSLKEQAVSIQEMAIALGVKT